MWQLAGSTRIHYLFYLGSDQVKSQKYFNLKLSVVLYYKIGIRFHVDKLPYLIKWSNSKPTNSTVKLNKQPFHQQQLTSPFISIITCECVSFSYSHTFDNATWRLQRFFRSIASLISIAKSR